MKRTGSTILMLLFVYLAHGQGKNDRTKLGLFSSHPYNFEYMDGKVKEIHYRSFHITDEDGKIVKGKPFTYQDADGVPSRQQRSYYYNELGQLIRVTITTDPNTLWNGIVHHEGERLENIYWLKEDTLMFNWDIVYPGDAKVERRWISSQNNELTGKQEFELDNKGNVVREMNYNSEEELTYSSEFTRRADGTLKSQKGINREGDVTLFISDWECNEKGLLTSSYLNILGGEEVNRKSAEVEYEYDRHGNWIKAFSRGEMLTERTIEYYE